MQTAIAFWDRIAPRYARAPIRDMPAYERTLARTRHYLGPGDRLLELGCGTGGTARRLAPSVAQVTATDISPAMIRIARTRAAEAGIGNLRFEAAALDAAATVDGVHGGAHDVALAFNLLHLLADPAAAVAGLRDAVRPGGLVITKTPCLAQPGTGWKLRLMLRALPLLQRLGRAPLVRLLSVAELEGMIADAGLQIVESGDYPANPPNRFVVARRPAA